MIQRCLGFCCGHHSDEAETCVCLAHYSLYLSTIRRDLHGLLPSDAESPYFSVNG